MPTISALALCLASLIPSPALPGPTGAGAAVAAGPPAAPLPASVAAQATGSVRDAERLRAQALAQRDIDALRRLISGDYYHVESNGRVRTKAEFLQALARDELRLRGYGLEDMEITLGEGGATAIVTGTYRTYRTGAPDAADGPVRGRYVRVWTRHPDGWRNALHQSTEIRPAPARLPRPPG